MFKLSPKLNDRIKLIGLGIAVFIIAFVVFFAAMVYLIQIAII